MLLDNNENQVSVKRLVLKKLCTPSVLSIIIISVFTLLTFKYWIWWDKNQFSNDVDQYYSFLVAQFIHHDLTFHFPHTYWLMPTPIGEMVPKVTMGIALLNIPFFVLADNIAYVFNYETLGYSAPYAWCIHFGAIFYVLIGLCYLRKTLLLFFNEWITALTLLSILFATNLFYYTYRETEMPHSYLFFLFSVFMYHVIKWHHVNKIRHLYFFCFTAGFIALIRPTEALILLIPLLYQVTSFKLLKEKFLILLNLKWKLVIAIFIFLSPIIPQLIFWKIQTGQFLFFSYGSAERFFFNDPRIYSVLLGWHKGWLIYTPLMILAITGIIIMFKKWRVMFFPIGIYLLVNIYLISSWWDWGFGGAYGMRALVQTYALMALPLAFVFNYLFKLPVNKWFKSLIIFFTLFFTIGCGYINIYQTYLLNNYYLHWDSLTKEVYFYTLFESNIDRNKVDSLLVHPNYEEMRKGNRDE
jgi:hypothetical protein